MRPRRARFGRRTLTGAAGREQGKARVQERTPSRAGHSFLPMSAWNVPSDVAEASRDQHCPELPATRQRCLALGHAQVFGDQRPSPGSRRTLAHRPAGHIARGSPVPCCKALAVFAGISRYRIVEMIAIRAHYSRTLRSAQRDAPWSSGSARSRASLSAGGGRSKCSGSGGRRATPGGGLVRSHDVLQCEYDRRRWPRSRCPGTRRARYGDRFDQARCESLRDGGQQGSPDRRRKADLFCQPAGGSCSRGSDREIHGRRGGRRRWWLGEDVRVCFCRSGQRYRRDALEQDAHRGARRRQYTGWRRRPAGECGGAATRVRGGGHRPACRKDVAGVGKSRRPRLPH